MREWIKLFNSNIMAYISQCGHLSEPFQIERGCKQGDPLSCYLFILCAEWLAAMIKNNKNIKGIYIGDFEHKLSQFADDTTIVLDSTLESLQAALNTIEIFGSYSGLKMNCDKTKIIWIGKKKLSKEKLNTSTQLIWGETEFDLLGLHFTTDLSKMISYNFKKYLAQVYDITKRWNRRYLTPIGKITIIKTYILSKFIHLFSVLPNPPLEFLKKLNTIIFNFIWDGKPDKINRLQVCRQQHEGGLKMINLLSFIKSLKLSWFRRMIQSKTTTPWITIVNYIIPDISSIFTLGIQTCKEMLPHIKNAFWYDTISAWGDLITTCNPTNIEECLNTPIWNNPIICPAPLYIKRWYNKGIKFIRDIVDSNMKFFELEHILNVYNVNKIDFLTYNRIRIGVTRLLNAFKNQIEAINDILPIIPFPLNCILKANKGVKYIYRGLTQTPNKAFESVKWNRDLNLCIDNDTWKRVFRICFNTISDNYLIWHSYKILTRILGCRKYLNQIKISNDPTCRLCNEEPETLFHLFFSCVETHSLWINLTNLIKSNLNIDIVFDKITVILGYQYYNNWSIAINTILIVARSYIFTCANSNRKLDINQLLQKIKSVYNEQLLISRINQQNEKFNKHWLIFKNLFNTPISP